MKSSFFDTIISKLIKVKNLIVSEDLNVKNLTVNENSKVKNLTVSGDLIVKNKSIESLIEEAGKIKTINGQGPDENGNVQIMEKIMNLGVSVDESGVMTISKEIPLNENYMLYGTETSDGLTLHLKKGE